MSAAIDLSEATAILDQAGPTVALRTATDLLDVSYSHGARLAAAGEFPVRIIRLGSRYRVVTTELRSLLGLDGAA